MAAQGVGGKTARPGLFEHVVVDLHYGHEKTIVGSPNQVAMMSGALHNHSTRSDGGFIDGQLPADSHGKWSNISSMVGYNASALICAVLVGAMFGMFCHLQDNCTFLTLSQLAV